MKVVKIYVEIQMQTNLASFGQIIIGTGVAMTKLIHLKD